MIRAPRRTAIPATSRARAQVTWLKLTRSGSTITGYVSTNGTTWTARRRRQPSSIATNARVGLVVTSHDTSQLNTATFDNVSVGQPPSAARRAGLAESGQRRDRRQHDADADVDRDGRDELRRASSGRSNPPPQVSSGQSAASYAPGDAGDEHEVLLADRRAQRRRHDGRAGLVVHDRRAHRRLRGRRLAESRPTARPA